MGGGGGKEAERKDLSGFWTPDVSEQVTVMAASPRKWTMASPHSLCFAHCLVMFTTGVLPQDRFAEEEEYSTYETASLPNTWYLRARLLFVVQKSSTYCSTRTQCVFQ